MQRRAAAVSVVVFLLVGAGAYAFIGVAQQPGFSVEADHQLSGNESFTGTDGMTYTATTASSGSATFAWTVEEAEYTETWQNASQVTYDGETFNVSIPNTSDPQTVTLREVQNVSAILANDSAVEDQPVVRADGRKYVVYTANGSASTLLSEYLPPQRVEQFDLGQTFQYRGNATNVSDISASGATLTWTAPRTITQSGSEGANVTLDQTYTVHFPEEGSGVVLTTDFAGYAEQVEQQAYYHERLSGLWAVTILSGIAVTLLVGIAYLPSRY